MRSILPPFLAILALPIALAAQAPRAMTFLDQQLLRQAGGLALSPDGSQLLYTISVHDWQAARRNTDLHVANTATGFTGSRQLTFTKDKNESSPQWTPDGRSFVFASDRDGATSQLYVMRPDGGEAQRITDAKDGVGTFVFTRDGSRLIFAAGKADEQQLWSLPVAGLAEAKATPLTQHATPVRTWQVSRDSRRVFFLAPDSVDRAEKERLEKKFDVRVRNQDIPLLHLWRLDLASGEEKRLTESSEYSVESFSLSEDGRSSCSAPTARFCGELVFRSRPVPS